MTDYYADPNVSPAESAAALDRVAAKYGVQEDVAALRRAGRPMDAERVPGWYAPPGEPVRQDGRMGEQPKMPIVRVTPEQAQQINKSLRPMKQLRTALYEMFHVRVVYWPPRAVLRQFKRQS